MNQNRTKASLLTFFSNTGSQVLIMLLEFLVRSVFIYKLGEAYLGISGLFKNILGVLSLADLGIGNAITYYLYKPAANDDHERLKSLMHLYKTVYNLIGSAIMIIGMVLMPFLPYLVKMDVALPLNLYLVYFLYVLNSTLTYLLFAYKALIFVAYQQMYKVSAVRAMTTIFSSILAILLLSTTRNFYAYLLCLIAGTVLQNMILGHMANKSFPFLKDKAYTKISRTELRSIFKNVYAAFIFKIGNVSLNSTDNILISMICGTIVVGYFNNYNLVVGAVTTLYSGFVTALLPSVGNLNAKESDEKQLKMLKELNFLNSWVLSFCAISLMVLLPPFINLWTRNTGNVNYLLPECIPILLALNFWIKNYMDIVAYFKDTKGLIWYGKYFQLGMGVANLLLSIILGRSWGLIGIVAATGISMLAISFLPYPYFLFHYGYQKSVIPFYTICLKDFLLLLLSYGAVRLFSISITQVTIGTFVYQCLLCVTVPNLMIYFAKRNSEEMQMARELVGRICHQIFKR